MQINEKLAKEFKLRQEQIDNTIKLYDDGKTIPFIARYRKEMTGSLDDQLLREIIERLTYLRNLEKRKEEIISAIDSQGKLTDEIKSSAENAETMVELEDIYRPFKQKKKTRASAAKEKGLETLSVILSLQDKKTNPVKEAERFINEEKGVMSADDALQGAMDIIAENISDDADTRKEIRTFIFNNGIINSVKAKSDSTDDDETSVYKNYFEFSESVKKIAGHRILAINRGENEGKLKVNITVNDSDAQDIILKKFLHGNTESSKYVKRAAEDSYSRLIYPSVEREIRNFLTEKADDAAIKVFASNLRELLMQQPVKGLVTLGLDPGFRTGCKVAVVDETGKVLDTAVVHITLDNKTNIEKGKAILKSLISKYHVNAISIGNGTASRESEKVVAEIIKEIPEKVSYMVVSEAGASVYSASKLAAEEFPEYDVSLRSAVSIARRLQDPLAELVKIEPSAIGVGQYQHDMPKAELENALNGVVEGCVNSVGVDLNTASFSLLSHVAGINAAVAKNIVSYREENGSFRNRKELLKVSKLGPKAFEQCAGFLRIRNGTEPLDNTAVHPESYKAAADIISICGYKRTDIKSGIPNISDKAKSIGLKNISDSTGVGMMTLTDILKELSKPGRDPRDDLPPPLLRDGNIMELKDLKPGMELLGTVRNVIDFGVFVDIGVHQDGLVHISEISSDRFIKHPLDAVKVGQVVKVKVLSVDEKRGRISLTMKR